MHTRKNRIQSEYVVTNLVAALFLASLANKNILFILFFCNMCFTIYLWVVKKQQYLNKLTLSYLILIFVCILIPCDIALRPSKTFAIRVLPVEIDAGASAHIRKLISQGKEENIDFVVYHGTGLRKQYSLTFTYPSNFISSYNHMDCDCPTNVSPQKNGVNYQN